MKRKIYNFYLLIFHFLIFISCHFKLVSFCAYLLKLSLFKKKKFRTNIKSNKIIIVLYRAHGDRDIKIIQEKSKKIPEIFFMPRSITKIIFTYFCYKKKLFFNYHQPKNKMDDYFNQKENYKNKHQQFWTEVLRNFKKYFRNKNINFVTFNYTYFEEAAFYEGCNKNNLDVKLWCKECFRSEPVLKRDMKIKKFNHMFKYFKYISVYNNQTKKLFIKKDRLNLKKITVNGAPRILDLIPKKKYKKKIKNILFLSFHNNSGIPPYKQNNNLNWNITYDATIDILNSLAKKTNFNIIIKRKNSYTFKTTKRINQKIKIFENGTSENFINNADIIIGQNSSSTIESIVNGKFVFVPFFEKKKNLRKFYYKFDQKIIFSDKNKLESKILRLENKKILFPLINKKNQKTIEYYYGKHKHIVNNYEKFLNC
jgi:hypothetical protein